MTREESEREKEILDAVMADGDLGLLSLFFPSPLPTMMHETYEIYAEEQEGRMTIKVQNSAAWLR